MNNLLFHFAAVNNSGIVAVNGSTVDEYYDVYGTRQTDLKVVATNTQVVDHVKVATGYLAYVDRHGRLVVTNDSVATSNWVFAVNAANAAEMYTYCECANEQLDLQQYCGKTLHTLR